MFIGQYILDENGDPHPEPDTLKWAAWYGHSHLSRGKDNRIVAQDHIDGVCISTVFLGLDHNHSSLKGPPVLWETMIFGGKHDGFMNRYISKDDAIVGHNEAVELARNSLSSKKSTR